MERMGLKGRGWASRGGHGGGIGKTREAALTLTLALTLGCLTPLPKPKPRRPPCATHLHVLAHALACQAVGQGLEASGDVLAPAVQHHGIEVAGGEVESCRLVGRTSCRLGLITQETFADPHTRR
jgi:hypothetical protein